MSSSNSLHRWRQDVDGKIKIYCFPHAGAGASITKNLALNAPSWIEIITIRLPGRETRFLEEPITNINEAVKIITGEIKEDCLRHESDFLLMGQCSGSILAYNIALQLQDCSHFKGLIVCSRPSPNTDLDKLDLDVSDIEFRQQIENIGGIDKSIIAEPSLLELLLPSIKADFKMFNDYEFVLEEPLPIPILAVRGNNDASIDMELFGRWNEFTNDSAIIKDIDGGHFLFEHSWSHLLSCIEEFILSKKITKVLG